MALIQCPECGKEILKIVGNLEEQIEILKQ